MKAIYILGLLLLAACGPMKEKANNTEIIIESSKQDSIFKQLQALTANAIKDTNQLDSLAFMILPLDASCPSCRTKTIDSIVKNRKRLKPNHFIVISAVGGQKTMNGYFKMEGKKLPVIENKLFLDSINMAYNFDLFSDNTVFYYTANGKAYKKISALPTTIKHDLQEFFSGSRNKNN